MMRFTRLGLGLLILACLLGAGQALAQTSMGGVNGTVTDPTGGVLPGATVTLVNDETGVQVVRHTDSNGFFNFVNVRPGKYTLTVELQGMKTARVAGFEVRVNETPTRNVKLEVGAITEVMEVTAQGELLQTASAELGQTVEEKVIKELPLQGRNFTQLLMLTPGVNPVSVAQGPQAETAVNSFEGNSGVPGGFIANASVQGQQNRSKIYYVDGIINSSMRSGTYVALPDIDSLQEFKVQSQSDKAEFGGVMGGVVNMTSKSGTNRISGSAFGFFRNEGLAARDPYRDATTPEINYKQGQFGLNVGAPIVKNKTFIFASYDGWRYNDEFKVRHVVPKSDAWLNGDFTGQQPTFRQIYNPYSTRTEGGTTVRDPFMCDGAGNPMPTDASGRQSGGTACNKVPQSLISPTMQAFLRAYMLRPNRAGSEVVSNFNFEMLRPRENNANAIQVRLDHHFSASDNIFVRWTERRISGLLPVGDVGFQEPDSTNRNVGGGWFHSFSPNMILEVRGGIATQPTEDAPLQHPAGLAPQQGLALPELDRLQGYYVTGLDNPWNLPNLGVQGPRQRENPNWNAAADLTWLRGKHSFKVGFQVQGISREQRNQFGEIRFNEDSATRNAANSSSTGDELASALMGLPNQVRGYLPDVGYIKFHSEVYSGYLQDQWAIKPNLTLTYGLRYDYVTKVTGGYDGMIQSSPDLATGDWLVALPEMPPVCSATQPAPCLPSQLASIPFNEHIKVTGERDSILKPITDNWGPRFGMSWQINPKTVLRAGYSLMWDAMVSRSQYGQHNYENGWPIVSNVIDTATVNTIGNTASGQFLKVDNLSQIPFGRPVANPWAVTGWTNSPDRKDPYSHQWHVELQRQLTRNLMVGAAYVGSYNGRMEWAGRAFAAKVPGIEAGTGRRLTAAEVNALRPWPHITSSIIYSDSTGMSKYNSFQFKAQQRFSAGLSSMLSYTYSKTIDTSGGLANAEQGLGGGGTVQNFWDKDNARGTASFDIPHILSWATVAELPFGRGKSLLNSGPLSWILGNWQMNWNVLVRSGQPFMVTSGGDPANIGTTGYARANRVEGQEAFLDEPQGDLWLNKAAFAAPVNSYGNMVRNSERWLKYWNVDVGLQKNIPFGGNKNLQLRLEAFNAFNHINRGTPNFALENSQFGLVTAVYQRPRQLQIGARMTF